jgi:hypothetical protein
VQQRMVELRMTGLVDSITRMYYLGLTLDRHWTFGAYFERLVPSI